MAEFSLACISVVILGASLGWPSPVLSKMEETGEPFRMDLEQVSWMVSLLYLGNMLSPLPAGYLMDRMGRKGALLLLSVFPTISWGMVIFASQPWMLYVARFLAGTWCGIVATIIPMYLGEISEPRVRGALSTFLQINTFFGAELEFIVGARVDYTTLGYLSGALPLIFLASFCFMPESPYWYLMKGNLKKASESLAWLRGLTPGQEKAELEDMKLAVDEEMRNKKSLKDLVGTPGNRKALLIVECMGILQRMSGISALMCYASTTLPAQGAGLLSRDDCVVVMGLAWLACVFLSTALVDSLGRKPLLLTSCLGGGSAMFAAGLWFYLDQKTQLDVSHLYWVPFASFLIYGLFFSVGLGPIAGTLQGECFPTNIKALASGLTSVLMAFTSFIMNKIYYDISDYAGMYLNYWIFAFACLIGAVFVITCVVETKGKTLHEIQEKLNKRRNNSPGNENGV